jgi:ABC-type glycerol-3-phosphate transport system substrate-binding protein
VARRPRGRRASSGILTAVNYAPTSDVKLDELGKRFGKAAGVTVRINHVQSAQMPAKLSAELMARSGHDIMSLEMHYPWLFQPGLVDVSDIAGELARKHGEWYPLLKEHAQVKGQWLGIPLLYTSFPGSHRIDLFEKVGERAPDTWEDLLAPAAGSRSSVIRSASPSARPRTP